MSWWNGQKTMTEKLAPIIYMPVPETLTPEQKEHWESELEKAERRVEDCMRILGYLAIERGLS